MGLARSRVGIRGALELTAGSSSQPWVMEQKTPGLSKIRQQDVGRMGICPRKGAELRAGQWGWSSPVSCPR